MGPPAMSPIHPIPVTKRSLDVVLSGLGLVAWSPVWALLATLVKLEDGGPIFYGQERLVRAARSSTRTNFDR